MRPYWLVLFSVASGAVACGSLGDDTGNSDPGTSTWPWVCADGGVAPEAGCAPLIEGGDEPDAP